GRLRQRRADATATPGQLPAPALGRPRRGRVGPAARHAQRRAPPRRGGLGGAATGPPPPPADRSERGRRKAPRPHRTAGGEGVERGEGGGGGGGGGCGMIGRGTLQREKEVIHVLVTRLEDLSDKLADLETRSRDFR